MQIQLQVYKTRPLWMQSEDKNEGNHSLKPNWKLVDTPLAVTTVVEFTSMEKNTAQLAKQSAIVGVKQDTGDPCVDQQTAFIAWLRRE